MAKPRREDPNLATVALLADYWHAGVKYPAGKPLRCPRDLAACLVRDGVADDTPAAVAHRIAESGDSADLPAAAEAEPAAVEASADEGAQSAP